MANSTIVQEAVQLDIASRIPLFTSGEWLPYWHDQSYTNGLLWIVASLTWILHDYCAQVLRIYGERMLTNGHV